MKRFQKPLVIVDTEMDNAQVLRRAVALANNNQAPLTICAVVEMSKSAMQTTTTAITPEELLDLKVVAEQEQLQETVVTAAQNDVEAKTTVLVGNPFLEIIRLVLLNEHDLVIKCAESSDNLKSKLFGSTDMHLMRKCPSPVWIIKPTETPNYRRILAAVDQDPEDTQKDVLNRQILEIATSLAVAEFSELHIVHAWDLFAESFLRSLRVSVSDEEVDEMVAEEARKRMHWLQNLISTYGGASDKEAVDYLKPQLHLAKGDPKHIVPATVEEIDAELIVMGTVARTGIAGFLMGNTAESILNQIDCSVLTVKPPSFVSPVALEA